MSRGAKKTNFMDSITVKNRIIGLVAITGIVIAIVTAGVVWWKTSENLNMQKRQQIEYMTEAAVNVAKMYNEHYKKGDISLEEAKNLTKEAVVNMRYDGGNYIWINDYEGTMLSHPKTALIGKDFNNVKDEKGNFFVPVMIEQCKKTGVGFTQYWWTKPGEPDNKIFPKFSASRGFAEWNWMFATGVYVDDVAAAVNESMIMICSILAGVTFLIIILAYTIVGTSIVNPVVKLTEIAKKLAANDLTVEVEEDNNKTEIGELNRSFSEFITNFKHLIGSVNSSSQEVASGSQQMSAAAEQTAIGAQQVASNVTQVAAGAQQQAKDVQDALDAINEVNQLVQEISTSTDSTVSISLSSEESAKNGTSKAEMAIDKINRIKSTSTETSKTINELGVLSKEIEQILELIKTIASQTNLLALNAAIEAARAGEHGKGFAVVAEEVKKLAGESADATDRITDMIKEIQNKTNLAVVSVDESVAEVQEGVTLVEDVGASLSEILISSGSTLAQVKDVSANVLELATKSSDILKNMEGISAIVEESAASTEEISSVTEEQTASLEEITSSSQEFAKLAEDLQHKIAIFKV